MCPTVNSRPGRGGGGVGAESDPICDTYVRQEHDGARPAIVITHTSPDWTIQVRIIQVLVRACFDFGRAKRRNAERKEF